MTTTIKCRWLWLTVVLLAACSKTPKQQLLAGFAHGCYAGRTAQVKQYCDCMVKNLDAAAPANVFNDPKAEPAEVAEAFAAMAMKWAPVCKAQLSDSPLPPPDSSQLVPAAPTVKGPTQDSAPTSDGWKSIQKEITDDPHAYVQGCIEGDMASAQKLGGASRAEAESHRTEYQASCAAELLNLQRCMALDAASSEQCYERLTQDKE